MRLFDSVSRSVVTLREGALTWYSCGPTVYDKTHLGHARNYVCVDVLQRVCQSLAGGAPMFHVMGVTDVDDKILARAKEQNKKAREVALEYEREFVECMARLGVRSPIRMTVRKTKKEKGEKTKEENRFRTDEFSLFFFFLFFF